MSEIETNLCLLITRMAYGDEIADLVFYLKNGRKNFKELLSRMTAADVKPSLQSKIALKQKLFVCLQQRIVSFSMAKQQCFYKLEIDEILLRLRFPLFIEMVWKLGESRKDVFEKICVNGIAQEEELGNQEALDDLIARKYVIAVEKEDFQTLDDKYLQDEEYEIQKSAIPLSATEMKKLKNRLKAERMMEKLNPKRRKLDGSGAEKKYYRINPEQFYLELRNASIVNYTSRCINQAASDIVEVFIGRVLNGMHSVHQELSASQSVLSLGSVIAQKMIKLPVSGEFHNPLAEYCSLLSSQKYQILFKEDSRSDGLYQLNLRKTMDNITIELLQSMVTERHGSIACRIFRLLLAGQKLDDKQISKLVLVDEKKARNSLYAMLQTGLVFMQDVPKTIDHSASRTAFLWYVNVQRSKQILLNDIYKTLFYLLKRQVQIEEENAPLVKKASRVDLQEGTIALEPNEVEMLQGMEGSLEQIGIQVGRIDEILMLLKDLQ